MIDTVRYTCHAPYRQPLTQNNLPHGWRLIETGKDHSRSESAFPHFRLENDLSGMVIYGNAHCVENIQVSLPRVLWGHNGRLITTQQQLEDAIGWAIAIAAQVLDVKNSQPANLPGFGLMSHFTRIDLVWQFPAHPSILDILENADHPRIRKRPIIYQFESVTLPGSLFRIRAYDKIKEMKLHNKPGNQPVHRLEVQLKQKALDENRWVNGEGHTKVSLQWALGTYRKILSELNCEPRTQLGRGSINDFLAYLKRDAPFKNYVLDYCHMSGLTEAATKRKIREVNKIGFVDKWMRLDTMIPVISALVPLDIVVPDIEQAHSVWLAMIAQSSAPQVAL